MINGSGSYTKQFPNTLKLVWQNSPTHCFSIPLLNVWKPDETAPSCVISCISFYHFEEKYDTCLCESSTESFKLTCFNCWFAGLRTSHDGNENITKKTKALHVRFKFWYISSPHSAKQQREMTKFKVLWGTCAHDRKFFLFLCQLIERAVPTWPVTGQCGHVVQDERNGIIAKKYANLYFQATFSLAFLSRFL